MKKFIYLFSLFTVSLTLVLLLVIYYWEFYPDIPLTITHPEAVQVDKTIYHPGDLITYTITYCKSRNIIASISRSLVNSTRTLYTTVDSNLPVGCHTVAIAELEIPKYTDAGEYHLEATASYKINPLRVYNVNWRTVDFKIIK